MKRAQSFVVSLVLLACVASTAYAHHGFTAHFDPDQPIRIEGTIKEIKFMNPQSLLYIDTVTSETIKSEQGSASFILADPGGNTILIDQHV